MEQPRLFNIPRQPLSKALISLAEQGRVSISTGASLRCAAQSHAVVGRLTIEGALRRMLEGTGCGFRMVDAQAVEIVTSPVSRAHEPAIDQPLAPLNLDELVVVATRRATAADRLAYAVSTVDGATLESLGVHDAGDLAATVPSMTVTNLGAGRDKIMLRGLSDGPLTGRTQSMVGIYLDDVRLTYNAPDPDLQLVDMAGVEVLRGPQGALYGAGSLGGVVHLVTAKPQTEGFNAWASATEGLTRHGGGSTSFEGMANLPFGAGRGALRVVGYRDAQGGYIDDPALNQQRVNTTIITGVRVAATWSFDERWTASGGLVSQAINSADTQYSQQDQPAYTRRNQLREPHDNDFVQAHVGLEGGFRGALVKVTTAVVRHGITSRYDATASPPVPVAEGPIAFDDGNTITSLTTEATITSTPDAPVQWLAGLFLSDSEQDTHLRLTSLAGAPATPFLENRQDHLEERALFGEVILPVTGRLSVTLGGRAFASEAKTKSVITMPLAGGASSFAGAVTRNRFAPKIMVSYAPGRRLLFYAQAAEGYRVGGINTTGTPDQAFSTIGGVEPNRYYQGDELWNFEAGVRAVALDNRLTLRAAVFDAVWKNIQSDQLLPSGLPFTANIGDGHNRGLEFEGRFVDGELVLTGQFLANEPELSRANPAFLERSELGLAGVPNASAGLSARYAWSLPQGLRFELDGRYAYIGTSHLTFDATTSPRMGGYSTDRVAASLAGGRWRLTLAAENLTDQQGDTFAYGNPFTLRTTPQVTPLRPRTVSLGLKVSY